MRMRFASGRGGYLPGMVWRARRVLGPTRKRGNYGAVLLSALLFVSIAFPSLGVSAQGIEALIEHGRYIFNAAGCGPCHTLNQPLAGGRPIVTPYGTFYTPNITSDRECGIGSWSSDEDFVRALREGVSPRGEHYYPVFPYSSFTRMSRSDMLALRAYLMTQPKFAVPNRPHELPWFLTSRPLIARWKERWFTPGGFVPDPAKSAAWNRGAYIAQALGHCGECHTPRGFLGGPCAAAYLAGSQRGPEGNIVPNITSDRESGIGDWTHQQLITFLTTGRKPDGSTAHGLMAEVIAASCMHLNDYDRYALATYLSSVPAVARDGREDAGSAEGSIPPCGDYQGGR